MPEQRPDAEETGTPSKGSTPSVITRVRHEAKIRTLLVRRVSHIAPRMVRIILAGDDLEGFVSLGFDDHVKLFIPPPGVKAATVPVMGPGGPVFPEGAPRPTMRDFTPRKYDADAGELTIDFALHDAGPATAWATKAQPGDSLAVGGPRGSMIIPLNPFARHILIGDETALPAIGRRLEELPARSAAIVFAEVDEPGDELVFASAADLNVTWAYRRKVGSEAALVAAVRSATLDGDDAFAWIACETSTAKLLRSHLVADRGFDPKRVKAAGYWRRGSVAVHDVLDD